MDVLSVQNKARLFLLDSKDLLASPDAQTSCHKVIYDESVSKSSILCEFQFFLNTYIIFSFNISKEIGEPIGKNSSSVLFSLRYKFKT